MRPHPSRVVLENLMRPYLLARVLLGVAVLAVLAHGARVAIAALMSRETSATEAALALDRRAELMATIVKVAAVCASLGLISTVLAADRAHESIRGAMCAYGVLTGTEHGIASLGVSAVLLVASAAWLGLHRLDLRLERGDLVRTKLRAVLVLAPLALVDLVYVLRFVSELDFDVVASCCSTAADSSGGRLDALGMGGSYAFLAAATLTLTAGASMVVIAMRRGGRAMLLASGALVILGVALAVPTVVDVVAPHVYGAPTHRCPFCLLHREALYVGYPLLVAAIMAVSGAASLLVTSTYARVFPAATSAEASHVGARTIAAVAVLLVLVALPLARYAMMTGTLLSL